MHTCSKCSSRIDMNDHFVFIFFFDFLPGRYNQNIIHIKLLKILFPIINPVYILSFVYSNTSFTNITEQTKSVQFLLYRMKHFFLSHRISIHNQSTVLIFFNKKTQICNPVIFRSIRQNVHKHLLFFQSCQRYFILNLSTFQTNIIQGADNNILSLCRCLYSKFLPLHLSFTSYMNSNCHSHLIYRKNRKSAIKRKDGFALRITIFFTFSLQMFLSIYP